METISVNEKFNALLKQGILKTSGTWSEETKVIVEKYDADNVKSDFSEKLSTISDPFERVIVFMHFLDETDLGTAEMVEEARKINSDHRDLGLFLRSFNGLFEEKEEMDKNTENLLGKYLSTFK
jgi:hypothetical protein